MSPGRHGIGGFAACVAAVLSLAPAFGDTPQIVLVPRINALLDEATEHTATFIACLGAGGAAGASERARWEKTRAVIVATLWATDFPEATIHEAERRTMLPDLTGRDPTDEECIAADTWLHATNDDRPHMRLWTAIATAGIDFSAIRPMTGEGLAKVEAAYAAVLPKQAVALVCWRLAMAREDETIRQRDPTERLWIEDLAKARALMHDAGWPHPVIDRIVLPGQPRNLLGRREAAAMNEAGCAADKTWMKWLYDNRATAARKAVETVIAESPAP